ncbi:MAG: hypothetical protein M3P41_09320 [Actinomycetota bacterium]|jgi:hypothetical protein|nr:hypothetical protein [Actinomycetota bacterium]
MTCDFSLAHYRELLRAARAGGYRCAGFDRAPRAGDLILRHDVDLSLEAAIAVAEAEADEDTWSTWFLMTRSIFYNLASAEGALAIERLRDLGHRVAHHAVYPYVDLDGRFDPVVAWHNPDPEYMQAPIEGAVNAMQPPFFDPEHYRSDSNQRWRHGCPHEELAAGRLDWLQLLTHPEIWAFDGATMRESMESMLDADRTARLEHLRADRIDLS